MTPAVSYRLGGVTLSRTALVSLALVPALAGVLPARLWRVTRLAVTAVHEGGHAIVAVLAGQRVTAVHLRSDTSGVTFHQGKQRWTSRVATAGAGYPAPGTVAVAGAALTARQDAHLFLAVLCGLGALMVVGWVRNLFGFVVLAILVGALGWLLVSGTRGEIVLVGAAIAWFLAMGGLRSAIEQFRAKGRGDAFELASLLHLPPVLCRAWFVALTCMSVAVCAGLLFLW